MLSSEDLGCATEVEINVDLSSGLFQGQIVEMEASDCRATLVHSKSGVS